MRIIVSKKLYLLSKHLIYRTLQRGQKTGQKSMFFVRFLSLFHAYVYVKASTVTSRGTHLSMMNYFYFFYNVLPLKQIIANTYTGIPATWITITDLQAQSQTFLLRCDGMIDVIPHRLIHRLRKYHQTI